jgi:hypothetical protein
MKSNKTKLVVQKNAEIQRQFDKPLTAQNGQKIISRQLSVTKKERQ